jgi:hypothetical protein
MIGGANIRRALADRARRIAEAEVEPRTPLQEFFDYLRERRLLECQMDDFTVRMAKSAFGRFDA